MMRLPLVITAITNSQAALILRHAWGYEAAWTLTASLSLVAMSLGLYGFAMVANDIVDWRRDQYLFPQRPLPSGRIGMQQAYMLAAGLLVLGVGGGVVYAIFSGGLASAFFLAWCVALIFFYNLTGKFVGAVGILTLGLLRFCHAAVGQPNLDVIWHALLLMDHVVVVTALAYILEGKRPRLTAVHRWGVGLSLLGLNVMLCLAVIVASWWRNGDLSRLPSAFAISSGLWFPAVAALVFAAFASALLLSLRSLQVEHARDWLTLRRSVGRKLMWLGLVWMVVYDLAFSYGYLREHFR